MSDKNKKTCTGKTLAICESDKNCSWVQDGARGYCQPQTQSQNKNPKTKK